MEGRREKGKEREGEFPMLSLSLDRAINAQSKAAGTWGLCLPNDSTTLEESQLQLFSGTSGRVCLC